MARPSALTLFDLPTELHLQIFDCLDYPSCLALAQTNSFFRSRVTVEKPITLEQKLLFLCATENWTRQVLPFTKSPHCYDLHVHHLIHLDSMTTFLAAVV